RASYNEALRKALEPVEMLETKTLLLPAPSDGPPTKSGPPTVDSVGVSRNCARPVLFEEALAPGGLVYAPLKSNCPRDHGGCRVENLTCWYSKPILKVCFP